MKQLRNVLAQAGYKTTRQLRRLRDAAVSRALSAQDDAERDAARAEVARLSVSLRR